MSKSPRLYVICLSLLSLSVFLAASAAPTARSATLTIRQLVSSDSNNCIVYSNTRVRCWGRKPAINKVPSTLHGLKVSLGGNEACAVTTEYKAVCWGRLSALSAVPRSLGAVSQVAVGAYQACGLRPDHRVICWGVGAKPPSALRADSIAMGTLHGCAVIHGLGRVLCWGSNLKGAATPPFNLPNTGVISAGLLNSCIISGKALAPHCWGYNVNGKSSLPRGTEHVWQIVSSNAHSCALKFNRTVICWGYNGNGQASVPAGLTGVKQISVGALHSCALTTKVVCWGYNGEGQLNGKPGGKRFVGGGPDSPFRTLALFCRGSSLCHKGFKFNFTYTWNLGNKGPGVANLVQIGPYPGSAHTVHVKPLSRVSRGSGRVRVKVTGSMRQTYRNPVMNVMLMW